MANNVPQTSEPKPAISETPHISARLARREALARLIAAEKCGLIQDPLGQNLHEHIWRQGMARAEAVLILIRAPS